MNILVRSIEALEKEYNTSRTPVLTYCRQLVRENIHPHTQLQVTRMGKDSLIINNIYEAAKITVLENDNIGPLFVKYRDRVREFK